MPYLDGLLSQSGWQGAIGVLSSKLSSILPADWTISATADGTTIAFGLNSGEVEILRNVHSLEEVRRRCAAIRDHAELLDSLLLDEHRHAARIPLVQAKIRIRRSSRVADILKAGQDVLLVGPSSSGKSVSAAIAARDLETQGCHCVWLDLGQSDASPKSLLCGILRANTPIERILVIVDNLQSNPELAAEVLRQADWYRGMLKGALSIIACSWPSAAAIGEDALPSLCRVTCNGSEIVRAIAEDAFPADGGRRDAVIRVSGRDALVAHYCVSFLKRDATTTLIDRGSLANYVFDEHFASVPSNCFAVLRRYAALGTLEIEVAERFALTQWPSETSSLIELGVLRRDGGFLSIGHRSLCSLAYEHVSSRLTAPMSIVAEAVVYLRSAGSDQIRATLSRLDLLSLQGADDQHGSAFLARAWRSCTVLGRIVTAQTERDSSWANNTASAVFAARALSALGMSEQCHDIVSKLRQHWVVSELELPKPTGAMPAERADFSEIGRTMAEEDASSPPGWSNARAQDIDFDKMHQTWVAGLLLGLASTGTLQGEYFRCIEKGLRSAQLPSGAFYPDRVPWITARVLIGLADAGYTYDTSTLVRDACDWLVQTPPDGPCDFGVWSSGTGRWNSDVMTSAMCMLALARAGYSGSAYDFADTAAFVVEKRGEWLRPGREIDTAIAIEALLASGRSWREANSEILRLLQWAGEMEPWADIAATAGESNTESSKASFVASSIAEIVWNIVRDELPLLLEGIVVAQCEPSMCSGTPMTTAGIGSNAVSRERVMGALKLLLSHLTREEESRVSAIPQAHGYPIPAIEKQLKLSREKRVRVEQIVRCIQNGEDSRQYENEVLDIATAAGFRPNDLGLDGAT